MALFLMVAVCPPAYAGWSQALPVHGSMQLEGAAAAFDADDTPWLAWAVTAERGISAPPGIYVAKVSGHYALTHVHRVPGTAEQVDRQSPVFSIDPRGFGILAWQHSAGWGPEPQEVSATTWRLGFQPGPGEELESPGYLDEFTPAIAVNDAGLALILYGGTEFPSAEGEYPVSQISAERVRGGRLLGSVEFSTPAAGSWADKPSVTTTSDDGFHASWELERRQPKGSEPEYVLPGVVDAGTGPSGVFSSERLTPWPAGVTSVQASYIHVLSNARGDQLAWWVSEGDGSSARSLYVTSRRPGQAFSATKVIARGEQPSAGAEAEINAGGTFALAWAQPIRGARFAAMVVAGHAGGSIATPDELGAASSVVTTPQLIRTTRGELLAVWTAAFASGRTVTQSAASSDWLHFTPAQTIFQRPCNGPSVWADRDGGALAAWACHAGAAVQSNTTELSRYTP